MDMLMTPMDIAKIAILVIMATIVMANVNFSIAIRDIFHSEILTS